MVPEEEFVSRVHHTPEESQTLVIGKSQMKFIEGPLDISIRIACTLIQVLLQEVFYRCH